MNDQRKLRRVSLLGCSLILVGLLCACHEARAAEVSEDHKNTGGLIGSSSVRQVFSATPTDVSSAITQPLGIIRDMVVSPDNSCLYTVEVKDDNTDAWLAAYDLADGTPTPAVASRDSTSIWSEIRSPRSLAITPDATLAFIAGSNKIMVVNLKKITNYTATGRDPPAAPYGWQHVLPIAAKNYTKIAVGPSGKRLYYLVDNSWSASQPYGDSTVFGEFGAHEIDRSMAVKVNTSATTGPSGPTISYGVSATSFAFVEKKDLVRPVSPDGLGAIVERGGSYAFLGPYSLAISPDEDYALITARGPRGIGTFDPELGRRPPPDEAEGGILVVDLQDGSFGEYLAYLPTLVEGEQRLGTLMMRYARFRKHPTVSVWGILAIASGGGGAMALAAGAALGGGALAGAGAFGLMAHWQTAGIHQEYKKIYRNYGLLSAYLDLYSNDMVGASDVAIDPGGNWGVVPMKSTNNVGFLRLEPSKTVEGYFPSDRPGEDFIVKAATEKDLRYAETGVFSHDWWPEAAEFSRNGAGAYVGMRGGLQTNARFGFVDMVEFLQEARRFAFRLTALSLFALETEDGLPSSLVNTLRELKDKTFDTEAEFVAELDRLGVTSNADTRATIKARAIMSASLSERGLPKALLSTRAPAGAEIRHPKRVAAFRPVNVDGDLLSDHLEAYNRRNYPLSGALFSTTPLNLTNARTFNYQEQLGVLLPRSGVGYRHNEQHGENQANVGKPYLTRMLERVGRIWHKKHMGGEAGFARHPHFVVIDMSPPGWGTIENHEGDQWHYNNRDGHVASIQYFHANGSDDPFEFVLSNNGTSPLNNSVPNPAPASFDRAAAHALIDLLLAQPEVVRISLDPGVAYTPASRNQARIEIRGEDDNASPGTRRDMDAWMQVAARPVAVDLVGCRDIGDSTPNWQDVPDWREQIAYGPGVSYVSGKTRVRVDSRLGNVEASDVVCRLFYAPSEVTVTGVPNGAQASAGPHPVIVNTLPPQRSYTDITLRAFYADSDEPFAVDTVSITREVRGDLIAMESGAFLVPETHEERPEGPGAIFRSAPNQTILIPKISDSTGSLRLRFDPGILSITQGATSVRAGDRVTPGLTYTVDSWNDPNTWETDVRLRVYDSSGGYLCEDVVSLTGFKVDIATDVNDDGIVDFADDLAEECGAGEIVRLNDDDDFPGGEDDLQYVRVTLETAGSSTGVAWLDYDAGKVKVWEDLACTQHVPPGTAGTPNWDLDAGDTVPGAVYVEGLSATRDGESTNLDLHWRKGTAQYGDTIVMTVTDRLGHRAYFRAVRDYIKEYRGPSVSYDFRLFEDEVDIRGRTDTVMETHNLVAVLMEETRMHVDAARVPPVNQYYGDVMDDYPDAIIIANAAFFAPVWPNGTTIGICIEGNTSIGGTAPAPGGYSRPLTPADGLRGWVGQGGSPETWQNGVPLGNAGVDPPTDGTIRAAVGGLLVFYPALEGKSIAETAAYSGGLHGWTTQPSSFVGWTSDDVLYFIVDNDGECDYSPPLNLGAFVGRAVASGAVAMYGLDGGSSIALVHRNRLGNDLQPYGSPGYRHVVGRAGILNWSWVSTYIVVKWRNP